MRELVYALIRFRIRTLYPESFIRVLWRSTMFRALFISFLFYIGLLIWFLNIEIRPHRQVALTQDLTVTVTLPPPETDEELPGALIAGDEEEPVEGPGEGVFTPETDRALDQVDGTGGEEAGDEEQESNDIRGSDEVSREGYIKKDEKDSPIVTLGKKESDKKTDVATTTEEVQEEQTGEQVDQTETNEQTEETEETTQESREETREPDTEEEAPASPVDIMPAYVIDRPPEIVEFPDPTFPTIMKSEVMSRDVRLRVYLDDRGTVRNIDTIESGGREFNEIAYKLVLSSDSHLHGSDRSLFRAL